MTTRNPEDGLLRTRRSLSIASVILILITVAGIKVTGYKLPWIEGDVERPENIYLAIWVALIYWTIAYLQFLFSSKAGKESYKLVRTATEVLLRKTLVSEHAKLIAEKKKAFTRGDHDDAEVEINFQGDWIAVFRGRGIKYGNKFKTNYSGGDWMEFHDIKLAGATIAWAKIRAFFAELTKSPILWDYVPLLLALAAAGCGVYEFLTFKGYLLPAAS